MGMGVKSTQAYCGEESRPRSIFSPLRSIVGFRGSQSRRLWAKHGSQIELQTRNDLGQSNRFCFGEAPRRFVASVFGQRPGVGLDRPDHADPGSQVIVHLARVTAPYRSY